MTTQKIYTATIRYREEKPFGVGHTLTSKYSRIVSGWRGEIISGLEDGQFIYTGVCDDREQVKQELIGHLKNFGLSGVLRFA